MPRPPVDKDDDNDDDNDVDDDHDDDRDDASPIFGLLQGTE